MVLICGCGEGSDAGDIKNADAPIPVADVPESPADVPESPADVPELPGDTSATVDSAQDTTVDVEPDPGQATDAADAADQLPPGPDPCLVDNGGCGPANQVTCTPQEGKPPICAPFCGPLLPEVSTCDFRVGLQGKYAEEDYSAYGWKNTAVFVHGSTMGATGGNASAADTLEEKQAAWASGINKYWKETEESVAVKLNKYCGENLNGECDADGLNCCASVEGIVILDIEKPYHPGRLATFGDTEATLHELGLLDAAPHSFEEVVEGFKWRISVAKKLLKKAKVGLYGIFLATGQAKYTDSLTAHIAKLKEGTTMGMLDELDLVIPIIYPRFGPDDGNYSEQQAWDYTAVTLEMTEDALSEMASPPAMAPSMSFKIFNGNSVNTNSPAPPEYLKWQIEALHSLNKAQTILIWAGKEQTIPGGIGTTLEALLPTLSNCMCE
jgi:hypothetical protein